MIAIISTKMTIRRGYVSVSVDYFRIKKTLFENHLFSNLNIHA